MNLWFLKRRRLEFHPEDIFSRQNIRLGPQVSPCPCSSKFFGRVTCGILVPQLRIKPTPPALGGKVLTTGLPGKSLFQQILDLYHPLKLHQSLIQFVEWFKNSYGTRLWCTQAGSDSQPDYINWGTLGKALE